MSHTFTFHFSKGPSGAPRIMVIIDLEASCHLCGYTEIQRFYHGTAFHPLTLTRFKRLVADAPQMLAYACSNCGESVEPRHAERLAITYGFADQSGLIQAFARCHEGQTAETHYILDPRKALDPQALPIWDRDDIDRASDRHRDLSDDQLFDVCRRVFTIKSAWRALWALFVREPDIVFERVAVGCWLVFGEDPEETLAWLDTLPHETNTPSGIPFALNSPPTGLPSTSDGRILPGRFDAWLQPEAVRALDAGECCAFALLDPEIALKHVVKTFKRARLGYTVTETGADTVLTDIVTPREDPYRATLPLQAILARAAYTGMTPGEAGRYTAEEIVGELMGLEV